MLKDLFGRKKNLEGGYENIILNIFIKFFYYFFKSSNQIKQILCTIISNIASVIQNCQNSSYLCIQRSGLEQRIIIQIMDFLLFVNNQDITLFRSYNLCFNIKSPFILRTSFVFQQCSILILHIKQNCLTQSFLIITKQLTNFVIKNFNILFRQKVYVLNIDLTNNLSIQFDVIFDYCKITIDYFEDRLNQKSKTLSLSLADLQPCSFVLTITYYLQASTYNYFLQSEFIRLHILAAGGLSPFQSFQNPQQGNILSQVRDIMDQTLFRQFIYQSDYQLFSPSQTPINQMNNNQIFKLKQIRCINSSQSIKYVNDKSITTIYIKNIRVIKKLKPLNQMDIYSYGDYHAIYLIDFEQTNAFDDEQGFEYTGINNEKAEKRAWLVQTDLTKLYPFKRCINQEEKIKQLFVKFYGILYLIIANWQNKIELLKPDLRNQEMKILMLNIHQLNIKQRLTLFQYLKNYDHLIG